MKYGASATVNIETSSKSGLMTETMAGLPDKVVLITGASAGIGEATAKAFAKKGCRLVLVARRVHKLREVEQSCLKLGLTSEKILVVSADVTREEDVSRIIQTTIQTFKSVDVLVNNVGGSIFATFEETTLEQFDQLMNLNLRSVFMMCKAALPYLIKSKGVILNISSTVATRPVPMLFTYSIAKAGLQHMARNLAKELAPQGIRVNNISPGLVKTEFLFTYGAVTSSEERDELNQQFASNVPLGRAGAPEEVAEVVVFAASDDAAYITGATIEVTGGNHLTV